MRTLGIVILLIGLAVDASASTSAQNPANLIYSQQFILNQVLLLKNLKLDDTKILPTLRFESQTLLKDFQDAIEKQWHMRPDFFSSAYAVLQNTIYLIDEDAYYKRTQRCMDDSLAHELTHYVQVQYQGADLLNAADIDIDGYEMDAIDVQTRFREKFCNETGVN